MIKHRDSHLDHGLTDVQVRHLLGRFADRDGFFVETFTLPPELGTVPCGLYGPVVGDSPIGEEEVEYAPRGSRAWRSRLIALPPRPQHEVTVIAGPHEATCAECDGRGRWTGIFPAPPLSEVCGACDGIGRVKYRCVLYTAFGGPLAPQEPDDPGCKDRATSAEFWRAHALAK
jgi:hypothetical protein